MSGHRLSITTRITVFAGAVAAVLSALLATVLMIGFKYFATENLTQELRANAGRVAIEEERGNLVYPLVHHQSRSMQVVDPRGRVVASSENMRGKQPMATFNPDGEEGATSVVCGGAFPPGECNIVVAQWTHHDGQRWTVYSASPVIPPWVDPRLATLVGGSAVALAAAVTYLGHRIATASLRPVDAIRVELDEINAACAGRRVPVPPSDDEIHDLAESVNHTLGRLQAAMEQQRQFVSDASHDLRSPIAAMKVEVEDALIAPQETSVTTLGSTFLVGLNRLQAIVGDLLALARLDAGLPGARDRIDLSELVSAECGIRHTSAKSIESSLEPGVMVIGDRLRLGRLLTNLVDNAERHAEHKITITVRHEPADERGNRAFQHGVAVLEVLDDGAGVEPDKRELVFQRFARLEASRNTDPGGTGLGLPIARQIAEAGGGTLRIEDSPRGARFVLRLPCAPSANDHGDASDRSTPRGPGQRAV
ncbi:two-component sensor histidine kinase [Planotetraspora thailandica]|uniref:histidine kinase n=1 Tax=Planotetraspora thailandica TaxID=487172 RepID=A0A8J3Y2V4_9ACTN|nr:HAMP domain-containing sensor histidine kinase [Planotetraspora thailandica]GII59719.1 two-component sensor histidine kinase [Planotetraspora thailandica]